jgi:putative membrane protein
MQMNNKLKEDIKIVSKGFVIGSSMSVPGVSGSTMAILLGIYDKLISSVSNFLKDIKVNFLFLLKICIGAGVGICSLSFLIKWLLEKFPLPVSVFFLGAVIGGIPALYKKTKGSSFKISSAIYFLIGLAVVIAIGFIPEGSIDISIGSGITHYLMLLVTGIIIALALVLPGISTSHMLLVLGMYDAMLAAITNIDVVYIGILGIATLIGVFLITKPLEWVMKSFPHQTYWMIIGFVIGSTVEIFQDKILPAIPESAEPLWWVGSIVISVIALFLGILAIKFLSRFQED